MERKKGGKMDEENGKLIEGEERFKRISLLVSFIIGQLRRARGL